MVCNDALVLFAGLHSPLNDGVIEIAPFRVTQDFIEFASGPVFLTVLIKAANTVKWRYMRVLLHMVYFFQIVNGSWCGCNCGRSLTPRTGLRNRWFAFLLLTLLSSLATSQGFAARSHAVSIHL